MSDEYKAEKALERAGFRLRGVTVVNGNRFHEYGRKGFGGLDDEVRFFGDGGYALVKVHVPFTDIPATIAPTPTGNERKIVMELVRAQGRMLERWSEGDDNVRNQLWKNLHEAGDRAREVLERKVLHHG
jgi:hypothetical protein